VMHYFLKLNFKTDTYSFFIVIEFKNRQLYVMRS